MELKEKNTLPSEFAEFIGLEYARSTSDKHKKDSEQFFTPKQIADFMGNLAAPKSDKISILDPGCGTGILACSLIEKSEITEIELTLFEIDDNVLCKTQEVIDFLAAWLKKRSIHLRYVTNRTDFILENSNTINDYKADSEVLKKELANYQYDLLYINDQAHIEGYQPIEEVFKNKMLT